MAIQFSITGRNARLTALATALGASPLLKYFTGTQPVDCATAASGTLLATLTLPASPFAAASGGQMAKTGSWTGTGGAGAGTGTAAGYYRLYDSAGTTCHNQGSVTGAAVVIATSALTAANGNVLTFTSTTGAVVGMNITGTGIPANATVLAVTGTTVTMSVATTAGVASAASISFLGDMTLDNVSMANGQAITVGSFTITDANA